MAYEPYEWRDGSEGQTPITAERLNYMEDGIADAAEGGWSAENQAASQGFWLVTSETPPTETEMYGVPVVWMKPSGVLTEIPALPESPIWDHVNQTFTVGQFTGIEWRYEGQKLTPSVAVPVETIPSMITVEAVALPGYTMSAPAVFHRYFYDPSEAVLIASDGFSGPAGENIVGRSWDMAFGGTTAPEWKADHSARSGPSLVTNGDGFLVPYKLEEQSWSTMGNFQRIADCGVFDMRIEMYLSEFANNATNANISLRAGGRTLGQSFNGSLTIVRGLSGRPASSVSFRIDSFFTPVTVEEHIGMWTLDHIQSTKTMKVTAPSGETAQFTYQTEDSAAPMYLNPAYWGNPENTAAVVTRDGTDHTGTSIDWIKVYRIGL